MRTRRGALLICAVAALACGSGGGQTGPADAAVSMRTPDAHVHKDAGGQGSLLRDAAVDVAESCPVCPAALSCVNGQCVGVIDFETLPGGAPSDGLAINTQFKMGYGVTFGFDNNLDGKLDPGASPVLAKVGPPATAFESAFGSMDDECAPGQNCGMYFLTDDGIIGTPPETLFVTYVSPVSAAYFEILDIDGTEGWTSESLDQNGKVIDSVVVNAGDPGTGDGIATPFAFKHMGRDIYAIRCRYTGTDVDVGLAFDNFSPTSSTPPPK